jgi:RNA polymerase sigma-70 factor (ECF subfamily)
MEDSEGVFTAGSLGELCVPRSAAALSPAIERDAGTDLEREVLRLFDEFRSPLLRYGLSLGISMHDAEEVVQETFLALFKHLQQGRPRANLRGWIFRVTHNLALKQSYAIKAERDRTEPGESMAEEPQDPAPTPEEQMSEMQRRRHLLAVVQALPQTDQSCLRLRAEGLRYREIAAVLGVSLGTVSTSLARSLSRLSRADGR